MLLALEVVCVALLVVGVALWSVPAALILAGVLGVIAIERATSQQLTPRKEVKE
ncbi:MAG: hypothetical protein M3467_10170 [Actinomycetota bacterium]|nr:hypothetical protein [Actinomycetota bacterium]